MTPEQFIKHVQQKQKRIERMIRNELGRRIGKIAVDHFKANFAKGGFVDGGLQKWPKAKREDANGKYAASKYGTLLSARKELYNSITYDVKGATIVISSDKEYAELHNEGGEVEHDIPISRQMRKFFWAKHYEETAGDKKANSKWKGLALTKKQSVHIRFTMPKRQFMGHSRKLDAKIKDETTKQLNKILKPQ